MSFPTSPTNGEKANVNGVTYTYNSTLQAWTVTSNFLDGVTANLITANNVTTANAVSATTFSAGALTATGNVTGGNVVTVGLITASGNIRGGNLVSVATVSAATVSATSVLSGTVSASGNVTGGNIFAPGLITATGNIVASGNIQGGNISATGNITGGNLVGTIGTPIQTGITAVGLLSGLGVSGNITGGNLLSTGSITANGVITAVGNVTGGNLIGYLRPSVGTTSLPPLLLGAGTNITSSPEPGAFEFANGILYATEAVTPGRGEVGVFQQFRYISAGSALGPAIADYFGTNSSMNLAAGSIYEIEAVLYFLKTTAGTATFTWAFSSAVEVAHSIYEGTAAAGFNTTAVTTAPVFGQVAQRITTAMAHAATASLTSAVYHSYRFRLMVDTNLATNVRLRITQSAGTATPQPGSYYRVRQLSVNTGNFAA